MLEIRNNENPIRFENAGLKKATQEITKHANTIKRSFYHIASILVKVENERLFVDDGFMSTAEYAEKTFGFKKTLCYNLLNIGKVYTAENGAESNLPHDKTKDYSSSQLKVMLPYDEGIIRELTDNEEITPYMSVRAIKNCLKELEGEPEQEDTAGATESDGDSDENKCPSCPYLFEIRAYTGEDGGVYVESNGDIPEIIADAINEYLMGGGEDIAENN